MPVSINLSPAPAPQTSRFLRIAGCLDSLKNRQRDEWTISQLNIQPYQQILEVGYGTGSMLQETAGKLKIGFLAGTDPSIGMYRQAYRRNKRFIRQQLLQLHIGDVAELPYPAHYFHTVYSNSIRPSGDFLQWHDTILQDFIRLANLLKNGGRLFILFPLRKDISEEMKKHTARQILAGYKEAGLTGVRFEFPDSQPPAIAVTGFKP